MIKTKIAQKSVFDIIIGFLYGFIIFLLMDPYFMWNTGRLPMYLSLVLVLITAVNLRKLQKSDIIVIPLFLFWFLYMYSYTNLFGLIGKSAILSFIFLKESKILYFFNWLKNILIIVFILSFITYILVVVLSVPIGYNLISPLNALKGSAYMQYPFLVLEHISNVKVLNIRFCSVFEEPGTVGSFATMFLFANNYNLKSKGNIVIFIAGIFSLSFFFYVSSILYLLYLSSNKVRISLAIVILSTFFLTKNIDYINYLVWDRFTFEDGKLKGDNRASINLDETFTAFLSSNDLLWGKGSKFTEVNELLDSSSYKMTILNYGMVFFVLLCLSFILFARFTIKTPKYIFGYIFLFIGMMYQRPGMIYYPAYIFVMIAAIYSIRQIAKRDKKMLDQISKAKFEIRKSKYLNKSKTKLITDSYANK